MIREYLCRLRADTTPYVENLLMDAQRSNVVSNIGMQLTYLA